MKRLVFISIVIAFWACNNDDDKTEDPIFCTLEARPGIEVRVKDAIDEMFLVEGVEVIITDGEYKETLTSFSGNNTFFGAYERVGTYIIEVRKNGYQTKITDPVVVEKDICHVITQNLEVLLEKN
ncbi:carboxypeptidase-like regulatory domain-containing protein [Aquimarina mytili]|uniref:Carboxypeptidase regulatory-like domain-containing protein n=1 Tax=Aquimarina mytili TaxID=874423 RepID=A0A937DAC6_9FLAO|nr:carboxypeptidase-like regulatory domain-containing protein [Aquimarina mytili]MBL0684612.1 carboxypeptidase regulatory-like domain-containing protein [Aquimarina mytili]